MFSCASCTVDELFNEQKSTTYYVEQKHLIHVIWLLFDWIFRTSFHILFGLLLVNQCRDHQLRIYGHVARLPPEDPVHRILSCRNPKGRPQASCLRQVEAYLKDMGMTGLASAWVMARRRPKEYRRKVDAATRCSGVCPHTWPDLTNVLPIVCYLDDSGSKCNPNIWM